MKLLAHLSLFAILLGFFVAYRCWTIPDTFIFRTAMTGSVYLPTFFPPGAGERLDFNTGDTAPSLIRPDTPPLARVGDYAVYSPAPTSVFCSEHKTLCSQGSNGIFILSGSSRDEQITSSSYARIDENRTSLAHLRKLLNTGAPSQRLFVVSVSGGKKIVEEMVRDGDYFRLNLNKSRVFSKSLLYYAVVLSFLLTEAFFLLLSAPVRGFFHRLHNSNPYATTVLVIWWTVFYACVFPSLFAHDTLIRATNAQAYTDWYSGLYFVYTSFVRIIGFEWIQLLPAVLGLLSAFLLLRCGDMATSACPVWQKRLLSFLTVISFIGNPAVVVSMFSQQRYFLVITVAFFAVSLMFYTYFRLTNRDYSNFYRLMSGVVITAGVAWLFRPEYFALYTIAIVLFTFLLFKERKILRPLRGMAALLVSACLILALKQFIDRALPYHYGFDSQLSKASYTTVSVVAMADPYVCASTPEPRISNAMGHFGPVKRLCAEGPEAFWWQVLTPQANRQSIPALGEMRRITLDDIKRDPMPFLRYRAKTGYDLLNDDIWQMESPYDRRDEVRKFNAYVSDHIRVPDQFGLVRDHPLTRGVARDFTRFYHWEGKKIGIRGLSVVVVVTFLVVATGWTWLTPLFSLLFLAMVVPVVMASPTINWAYIAFLPVWGAFVLPLGISEALIARKQKGRFLSSHFANVIGTIQNFIRFAALSGGGWILDLTTLLLISNTGRVPTVLANIISSSLASSVVFMMARRRIHDGQNDGIFIRTMIYMSYTGLSIGLASLAIPGLVSYINSAGISDSNPKDALVLAKVLVTPPQLICNYLMSRCVARWIFSYRRV